MAGKKIRRIWKECGQLTSHFGPSCISKISFEVLGNLIFRRSIHQAACPFVLQKGDYSFHGTEGGQRRCADSRSLDRPDGHEVNVRYEDFRVLFPTFRFMDRYVPATPQRYIKNPERSHRRSYIILRSVVFNSCGVKYCCTNADRNDDQLISQNRARELLDFNLCLFISSRC